MLIHSIMAHDAIFPQEPIQLCCVQRGSRWLEGTMAGGQMNLCRIISTDPADYLKEQWQPGKRIEYHNEEYK